MSKIILIFALILSFNSFSQTAEEYYQSAKAKFQTDDVQGAIMDYTKVIEIAPNIYNAYFGRALAKESIGDFRGAISDYTKVIALNPNSGVFYKERGKIKVKIKDYKGAILDYTKSLQLDPDFYYTYYWRAKAKFLSKNYNEAILDYDKFISKNGGDDTGNAFYERGLSKIFLNKKNGGCLDLSKSGELGNKNAYEKIKKYCN